MQRLRLLSVKILVIIGVVEARVAHVQVGSSEAESLAYAATRGVGEYLGFQFLKSYLHVRFFKDAQNSFLHDFKSIVSD